MPPVEAWKDKQRTALDELADVIADFVGREILAKQASGTADTNLRDALARRRRRTATGRGSRSLFVARVEERRLLLSRGDLVVVQLSSVSIWPIPGIRTRTRECPFHAAADDAGQSSPDRVAGPQ
jgi:hypothetical protein